jgi:protein AFG1
VETRLVAVPGHPLRRNPLFSRLFAREQERHTLALARVLTSHEAAMNLDSPKGLLLHGEVGTGKSMLLDLLADSLPNRKKRRWHFNTFMLEMLARLEQLRQSRSLPGSNDAEYSLIWLAKDLIDKSPIIFLDEFQLPDRAASKIMSNLFTTFFQLGGVLVATSNRMPDELLKASGMDFTAPPRGGLVRGWLSPSGKRKTDMFSSDSDYTGFVEVLKARCDIWNMEGRRDWRRRHAEEIDTETAELEEAMREKMVGGFSVLENPAAGNLKLGYKQSMSEELKFNSGVGDGLCGEESNTVKVATPKKYLLESSDSEEIWQTMIRASLPEVSDPPQWQSTTLLVYGRNVPVLHHLEGVTYWSFPELCGGAFGPADYITLASTFHTLILDEVPILTLSQKNEARRLITLLDALYEARCKLIMRAEAGPDDLFFPEIKIALIGNGTQRDENDGGDAVYPETFSEIYQDQTSPFRPNISSYTNEPKSGYDPDEDPDFGPIPGKGNEIGRQIDFGMTSSFTGEDERFAYKRARSRLWEMCGARWHARSDPGWWRPLPVEVRTWERSSAANIQAHRQSSSVKGDVKLGESIELGKPAGLQGREPEGKEKETLSPFREKRDLPPQIGWTHAWGMMKWGKNAGPWGQGPEGLDERKDRNGGGRR